jgi:hypothetical protein
LAGGTSQAVQIRGLLSLVLLQTVLQNRKVPLLSGKFLLACTAKGTQILAEFFYRLHRSGYRNPSIFYFVKSLPSDFITI